MISISVLFNPIIQIHFERNQWLIIDTLTIIVFLYSIPNIRLWNDRGETIVDYKIIKAINIIITGTLLLAGGVILWGMEGAKFDELKLIQNASTSMGTLDSTLNYEDEDAEGNVHVVDYGKYSFFSSDGQKYYTYSHKYLEKYIDIEYLPDNPSINRAKGEGNQSIFEWIVVELYYLALCTFLGILLIFHGIKEFRLRIKES